MNTYRAPFSVGEVVRDSSTESRFSKQLVSAEPLPLSAIREIYLKCKEGDESYGGEEGLRWSRRILKQEKLLKGQDKGTVTLPQWIDLQLGPHIFAAISTASLQKVASLMMEEEVVSCCMPFNKGTIVFFPATGEFKLTGEETPLDSSMVKAEESILVDENRDRLRAIIKAAGTETSRFASFRVGDPEVLSCGNEFQEFYLLSMDEVLKAVSFVKVDKGLGIVFGWGVICTENGEAYFDTQDDHAPDDGMLKASAEFMQGDRVAGDHHQKDDTGDIIPKGKVVFAWPMTKDIAEAFGFPTTRTGLMVGLKPEDPEILAKFESGEYTGFSIGGFRIPEYTEEVTA